MNLYDIKDADTGKLILQDVTSKEAAEILHYSRHAITQAGGNGNRIGHKYIVELVDEVARRNDPIWIDWELGRNKFLKLCGGREDEKSRKKR